MTGKSSKMPAPEDDDSSDRSVLDFLYHDSRRVGSFLSQFEVGHLQQLTQSKNGNRKRTESSETEAKGTVGVIGGAHKGIRSRSVDMTEGYSRVFDPHWTNARAFLNYLFDNNLIEMNVSASSMGQFVLARGYLSVLDLVMFKEAWKLPSLQRTILSGIGSTQQTGNMTAAQKAALKEQKSNTEMVLDLIQIMPHSIHASMITNDDAPQMVWCPLREEYMVTPASELVLMHGVQIPGEWSILGVMNAAPDYIVNSINSTTDGLEPGLMRSLVGQASNLIAPLVRVALGRPAAASAVTPLLIFREIAKGRVGA